MRDAEANRVWDLLSGHGLVLLVLAQDPEVTVQRLNRQLGYGERRLFTVLRDLEAAGFVGRERRGRNTRYVVNSAADARIPGLPGVPVGALLHSLRAQPAKGGCADVTTR